jgi:hypothetical protein
MARKLVGSMGFSSKNPKNFSRRSFRNRGGAVPTFTSNSTSRARLCSSFTSTLKDSGRPGSRAFSPFTMDSYIFVRPITSSDLTVRISCSVWAAP